MKIRIKNQNNKIFEAIPAGTSSSTSTASGTNSSTGSSAYNSLVGTIQNQYIQKQRKDATIINFAIPKVFSEPFSFGGAPQDIVNLMTAFQQNKARKTKNIGDMSEDPIQTFDHAHDYCKDIFGKYSKPIEFDTDSTTVRYNKAKVISDNFQYNYDFPTLNEGPIATAGATGAAIGNAAGIVGASGITFLNAAGATFLANIIPAVLPAVITGTLIGKGLAAVGDVRPGGISNDTTFRGKKMIPTHLQKDGMINKPAPTALDKKDSKSFNVIENIDQYIENILNSVNNVATIISPTTADKIRDLEQYVRDMMETETSNVKAYIAANSERAKKIQEERERRKREKTENELNAFRDKDKFAKKLYNLKINNTKEYAFVVRVINWYGDNLNTSNEQNQNIIQKLEDTDIKSIDDLNNIIGKKIPLEESINSTKTTNYLNEAEELTDNSEELTRNISKIYKQLHNKFLTICGDAFAATGKDLQGIADCKEEMQGMIKKADETINNRIDIISKYSHGNGGDAKGLSQQAKEFLLGHPLESNNLKEVWSRHLADLNGRMNKRLRQMQDAQNEERTLGWTKRFCKIVVPDLLARLLCYRYMYGLLLNEGFYSYNTEKMQKDLEDFDKVKDSYISDFKEKILWLLYHYSAKYTSTGNPIVAPSTDGGYAISENILSYGIFLLCNLNKSLLSSPGHACIYALGLANLQKIDSPSEKLDALINNIYNLSDSSIQNLMQTSTSDPDFENKFNKLAEKFEKCETLDKTKDYIRNTYNKINNLQSEIKENNKEAIYYSFEIFNQIKTNSNLATVFGKDDDGTIQDLITKYKNLQNTGNSNETDIKNSEEYKQIKNDLLSWLNNVNSTNTEFTVSKFNNIDLHAPFKLSEYNVDYYAYILQCWYEQMFGVIPSNIFDENTIKLVCNTVYNSLNFIMSGILSMLVKKVEAKVNNIDNNLPKVKETLVKLANGVNFTNKLDGKFFGDTSANSNQPSKTLLDLQVNTFSQLNNSYQELSMDSSILIPELFKLSIGTTTNLPLLSPALTDITKALQGFTDMPDNIRKAFNNTNVVLNGTTYKFENLPSDDDRNMVLNNIYNAIVEVENKGNLKKYVNIIDGIIKYCDNQTTTKLPKDSSTK